MYVCMYVFTHVYMYIRACMYVNLFHCSISVVVVVAFVVVVVVVANSNKSQDLLIYY